MKRQGRALPQAYKAMTGSFANMAEKLHIFGTGLTSFLGQHIASIFMGREKS
jgi:hypothetical protein